MKKRFLEKKDPTAYEIKKIILKDGTEYEVDKIVGFVAIKDSQDGDQYFFKMTYTAKTNADLIALSNECNLAAFAFKFMRDYNMDFETACKKYDEMLKNAIKLKTDFTELIKKF